jgi:hypothetical protein
VPATIGSKVLGLATANTIVGGRGEPCDTGVRIVAEALVRVKAAG